MNSEETLDGGVVFNGIVQVISPSSSQWHHYGWLGRAQHEVYSTCSRIELSRRVRASGRPAADPMYPVLRRSRFLDVFVWIQL